MLSKASGFNRCGHASLGPMKSETNNGGAVGICLGPRCGDYGGRELLAALARHGIPARSLGCQSLCPHAPVACLPDRCLLRATRDDLLRAMDESAG